MISVSTVQAALTATVEFDSHRLQLTAQPGTPLAELVQAARVCEEVSAAGQTTFDPAPQSYVTGMACDGESRHDLLIDSLSADIAKHVSGHLVHAKTVVRPMVTELVNAFTERVGSLPAEVSYETKIVLSSLPAPLSTAPVAELVEEFGRGSYQPLRLYVAGPERTAEQIIELLAIGAKSADDVVVTWAAGLGAEFINLVWSSVFTAASTSVRFDELIANPVTGMDAALLVFLLTHNLFDNPPEGVQMDLTGYNATVAQLRDQAALKLSHAMEVSQRNERQGMLIERIDDTQIVVNAAVYNKYKADGGQDVTLFGAALSDRPARYLTEIATRVDEFRRLWQQYNAVLNSRESNKRYARMIEALKGVATRVMVNHMDEIFAGLVPEGVQIDTRTPQYEQANTRLVEHVARLTEADLADIWTVATNLVCDVFFPHTSAKRILTGINVACKDNPGIDIREAVTIATIGYIVDWVCDQMTPSGF